MIEPQTALQIGFGHLIGTPTLDSTRDEGIKIVRISANIATGGHHADNMASPEKAAELATEVRDHGMQPVISLVRAVQVRDLPHGTLVEAGNEPDIAKFGWKKQMWIDETLRIIAACKAHPHNLKVYAGAVSNPNDRGFKWLKYLPWKEISTDVGCSFHWYPDTHDANRGHDGRSCEEEMAELKRIVGIRPMAVTECGFHQAAGGFTDEEVARNMVAKRRFFGNYDVEFVTGFQINDGLTAAKDDHYGWRRLEDGTWKPVMKAFVNAFEAA